MIDTDEMVDGGGAREKSQVGAFATAQVENRVYAVMLFQDPTDQHSTMHGYRMIWKVKGSTVVARVVDRS